MKSSWQLALFHDVVELIGVLNMETPAVGPAKQENTPQQEKAKTDDGKTFWEVKREPERQEIKQKKDPRWLLS